MMETPNIFAILDRYIDDLFAPEDEVLRVARKEARKAALPEIQVSSGQGKFIYLLAKVADKVNYPNYFPHIMRSVRPGALILADNVIRKGSVLDPRPDDPSAGAVRAFNAMIAADPRLEAVVLQQVGIKGHDGLAIARVK